MPNSGGYIYRDESTNPPKGASFKDVQEVLGINNVKESELCTSDKINMWAKYKPIRYGNPFPMTYYERKTRNFGLNVPYCYNQYGMNHTIYELVFEQEDEEGWYYEQPRGDRTQVLEPSGQYGVTEFYRIHDFVRNPSQMTPDPSDPTGIYSDPTPATLKGYNHNALLPFQAILDMSTITQDSAGWLNVNIQSDWELVFTCSNVSGGDITLQDVVDWSDIQTGMAWRPVVQIFRHWHCQPGDAADDGKVSTVWYERSNYQADMVIVGDTITQNGMTFMIRVPVAELMDLAGASDGFHLCVGIGCCDDNGEAFQTEGQARYRLFIMPYTYQQLIDGDTTFRYPFYYRFKVVSYFPRRMYLRQLAYGLSVVDIVGSTANIPNGSGGTIIIKFEITKLPSQALWFVSEHDTNIPTGYVAMRVCLIDTATDSTYYLQPLGGMDWSSSIIHEVPSGSNTERVTLYGGTTQYDVSSIPNNDYGRFRVQIGIGNQTPTDANGLAIHKTVIQ